MTYYIKRMMPFALFLLVLTSSCSESKTNNLEKIEIERMDSISNAVKINADKLEEQTKKVEQSLEKLDKEFEDKN